MKPDLLILVGPFVDISQPLLATGDVVIDNFDDDDKYVGNKYYFFIEKLLFLD